MRPKQKLRRLLRRLRRAVATFKDRSDQDQQVAWAAEARAVRAGVEAMSQSHDTITKQEYGAAQHLLLAMSAVAASVASGASWAEVDGHLTLAKRLLKGKKEATA